MNKARCPITIDVPFRSFLIIFNRYRKKAENEKENEYNDQVEYNRIRKESYRWTIKLAVEQFQVHYL